jgi:hypothetical protein
MNQATKDIATLLKVSIDVALKVQSEMSGNGLSFSNCSQRQFNAAAREAFAFLKPTNQI